MRNDFRVLAILTDIVVRSGRALDLAPNSLEGRADCFTLIALWSRMTVSVLCLYLIVPLIGNHCDCGISWSFLGWAH